MAKTHIMKDERYTYCSQSGRGPHATVYAVKSEEVTESVLGRSITCQRCARGFRRRLTLSPALRETVARRTVIKKDTLDAIDRIYAKADRARLQRREALQTGGPWSVLGRENAVGDIGVGPEDSLAYPVAIVQIRRDGETEANAALISAAPDLAKAAMSTIERLADLPRYLRNNESAVLGGIVQACLEALRAALQKSAGVA